MRVVTWNLFHGRDHPPDRSLLTLRSRLFRVTERNSTHAQVNACLLDEFAGWLARREWDIALLQEAPPPWLRPLATRARASGASALTSRNLGAFARSRLARLTPDLIASNEGGSNQLLVRAPARITEVRRLTLTLVPERRRLLWARLATPAGPLAAANLHATAHVPAMAARDLRRAAEQSVEWAGGDPLLLGGDFNLRPHTHGGVFAELEERFGLAAPTGARVIDHILARGLDVEERPRQLPGPEREVAGPGGLRLRLSDHAPVVASFGMR